VVDNCSQAGCALGWRRSLLRVQRRVVRLVKRYWHELLWPVCKADGHVKAGSRSSSLTERDIACGRVLAARWRLGQEACDRSVNRLTQK
jgi:hypothetical protein